MSKTSNDIFVVHPSVRMEYHTNDYHPNEYHTNVSCHDNEGFDQIDGSATTHKNNNYLQTPSLGGSSRHSIENEERMTFKKKLLYGLLIVAVFLLVNVAAVLISLQRYSNLEDKMDNKFNMLSGKIEVDEVKAQKAQKTIKALSEDSKSLRESVNALNILQRFTYVGKGFGVNKQGKIESINNDTLSSQVECLLFCYQCSLSDPAINAVTVIVANYDCYCEKHSVNMTKKEGVVHYLLSNPIKGVHLDLD